MAAVIRLARHGGKKSPFYRIIVTDRRNAGDGGRLEQVGIYDPRQKPSRVEFKTKPLANWLKRGARPPRPAARCTARAAYNVGLTRREMMKELVQYLARQLVNNPDAVEVKETQGETASVLELKVAKEDLGRIIGKQGRTAKSIRTILNAAASRTNRKVVLEIVEDQKPSCLRPGSERLPPLAGYV